MSFIRGAWKVLVAIKDGLVLVAILIFFGVLFAALTLRPGPAKIHDGALVLRLDGLIVEQPAEVSAWAALNGGERTREIRLRDLIRAIDTARGDARVKVVVLDLDEFAGGYPAAVSEVAAALGRVRAGGKPVLAYATAYSDAGYLLAASASEIWMNPLGGSLFRGPGGSQLYYKGLADKLGVTVHVYRVGKFKAAVEPYIRNDQSPESKESNTALYASLLDQWKALVTTARPQARVDAFLTRPDQVITAADGNIARANLAAGLVDKLGSRITFGRRVAQLAGAGATKLAGDYAKIDYDDWIEANPPASTGDEIGVVTIAGDIVDGKANPGAAGGDTIARNVLDGLAKKKLKALVVRVDSPGGSALASEVIRRAILEAKARKLPVVISMGSVTASGGYWIATAGDVIFAEPNTITGSIGVFGIIPSFENSLRKIGVTADGVKTTPLSGQPDIYGGTNPQVDTILQAGIENAYRQFISRVSAARRLPPARVDEIAQGRVWIGGAARQLGLVDRFGSLDDAIAEAARRAGLDPAKVRPVYLEKEPNPFAKLLRSWFKDDDDDAQGTDAFARLAAERRDAFARALGDARRLATGATIQARCLECAALPGAPVREDDLTLAAWLLKTLWG